MIINGWWISVVNFFAADCLQSYIIMSAMIYCLRIITQYHYLYTVKLHYINHFFHILNCHQLIKERRIIFGTAMRVVFLFLATETLYSSMNNYLEVDRIRSNQMGTVSLFPWLDGSSSPGGQTTPGACVLSGSATPAENCSIPSTFRSKHPVVIVRQRFLLYFISF